MSAPYRAKMFDLDPASEHLRQISTNSARGFWRRICEDPNTCIRTFQVSCGVHAGVLMRDTETLAGFFRTNQNLETVKLETVLFDDVDTSPWVLAAIQNPAVRHIDLSVHLHLEASTKKATLLFWAARSKVRKISVTQFIERPITEEDAAELGNSVASLSSIQDLDLSFVETNVFSAIMVAMSKRQFPHLKGVKVRFADSESKPTNLLGLGQFLKSDAASSLTKLDFVLNKAPVCAASMIVFLDGLAQNTSIKVLKMQGLDPEAASIFASYVEKLADLDELHLDNISFRHSYLVPTAKVGMLAISDTVLPDACLNWPSSVQSLLLSNWMLGRPRFPSSALIRKIMDPLALCRNLRSLHLQLYGTSVDAPLDIAPILDGFVAPVHGNRVGLTEFKLHIEGFQRVQRLNEESLSACSAILHDPHCRLEVLELSQLPFGHGHILSLLSGAQASSTLKSLTLESWLAASLETWMAVGAILPNMHLDIVRIDLGCDIGNTVTLQREVLKGLSLNTTIQVASFGELMDAPWERSKLEKLLLRNKVATAAKALGDCKLPLALAPAMWKAVQNECKYGSGMQELEEVLSATILFSLLRGGLCTENSVSLEKSLSRSSPNPFCGTERGCWMLEMLTKQARELVDGLGSTWRRVFKRTFSFFGGKKGVEARRRETSL